MIELMKYTYLMEPDKIQQELEAYRKRYKEIIDNEKSTRVEMNEARAILFLTGHIYCEEVAVERWKEDYTSCRESRRWWNSSCW